LGKSTEAGPVAAVYDRRTVSLQSTLSAVIDRRYNAVERVFFRNPKAKI